MVEFTLAASLCNYINYVTIIVMTVTYCAYSQMFSHNVLL